MRRNEDAMGVTILYGLGLPTGTFFFLPPFFSFLIKSLIEGVLESPPARPGRRIEFIGDSVTSGHGNNAFAPCAHNAQNQDVFLYISFSLLPLPLPPSLFRFINNFDSTFGPIAAATVEAEFSIVAITGKGIIRNYEDSDPGNTIPRHLLFIYLILKKNK